MAFNPFQRLMRRRPAAAPMDALYRAVVATAREPRWYTAGAVPDTLDGRFDMVALYGEPRSDSLVVNIDRAVAYGILGDAAMTAEGESLLTVIRGGTVNPFRRSRSRRLMMGTSTVSTSAR